MNKLYLSASEKQRLEVFHRHSKNVDENQRIDAILFKSKSWSISQIAQALRKHEVSMSRFINDYKNNNKLKSENGGSESHLNKVQTKDHIAHLEQNIYLTVSALKNIYTWQLKMHVLCFKIY
jgi:transposase